MTKEKPDNINALRELGWSLWDPIEILVTKTTWRGTAFEDEYDTYLIEMQNMARRGLQVEELTNYAINIVDEWMELGRNDEVEARSRNLAQAVLDLNS
jgi:hypothetical protein